MAVIEGGTSGALQGVGVEALSPSHVTLKPIPYGALGHYRVNHRCALLNAQAANSRIFEVRNTGTNFIVPTRLVIKWASSAAHTAILDQSLDCYKLTGFSVSSTTNTVTPTASVKKTTGMAAAPGGAAIRGLTVAGNTAGMTGFTSTKDGGSFFQLPMIEAVAVMAATETTSRYFNVGDALDDVNGTHPWMFAQNEGFLIEERAVEAAAGGSSVYIDFSWAEVTAF